MSNTPANTAPHIAEVRGHLMSLLAALCDRNNPIEPDVARAGAQVASVMVDTAKVELEYLRLTGQERSDFLETPPDDAVAGLGHTPASGYTQGTIARLPGVTQHRMKG